MLWSIQPHHFLFPKQIVTTEIRNYIIWSVHGWKQTKEFIWHCAFFKNLHFVCLTLPLFLGPGSLLSCWLGWCWGPIPTIFWFFWSEIRVISSKASIQCKAIIESSIKMKDCGTRTPGNIRIICLPSQGLRPRVRRQIILTFSRFTRRLVREQQM